MVYDINYFEPKIQNHTPNNRLYFYYPKRPQDRSTVRLSDRSIERYRIGPYQTQNDLFLNKYYLFQP